MNTLELITRIVIAKQGDAIGSQVQQVAENQLDEANPNALAYILSDLHKLQSVDWQDVAEQVDELVAILEEAGIKPRW